MRGKLGFLLGVAAGAVLGLVLAPTSGSKLRAEIKKEREDGGTGLNAIGSSVKTVGKDVGSKIKKSKLVQKASGLKAKLEDVIKNESEE